KLRRTERSGRQDDFAAAARRTCLAALPPAHTRCPPAVEQDRLGEAAGLEPQVGAMERRLEEGARRRPAPPPPSRQVQRARPFVVAGVEIGNAFDTGLLGRLAECIENVPSHPRRLDANLAGGRVRYTFAQEVVLVLAEEWQHVVGAPAGEPE